MAVNIYVYIYVCMFILLANVYVVRAKSEDVQIKQTSIQPDYFENLPTSNVRGAVVLKSDLPLLAQTQLAATLTQIYEDTADPMERLQQFQTAIMRMYSIYWTVIYNAERMTASCRHYMNLYVIHKHDQIFACGLE